LVDDDCRVVDAGILLQEKDSPTRHDQFDRLYNIYSFFLDLFTKYPIKQVAIEKLFFTSWNQSNAEFVYGVRGALIALAYEHNA
jgi:Holliday junction resolvasome RuvABC endonuclease subunit